MKVSLLNPAEIDEALSWQNTWLVFKRTTLSDALEAFNRHSSQQLILADPSLQGRRLDGKFQADHVEGFVRLIESRQCTCKPSAATGIRLSSCPPNDLSPRLKFSSRKLGLSCVQQGDGRDLRDFTPCHRDSLRRSLLAILAAWIAAFAVCPGVRAVQAVTRDFDIPAGEAEGGIEQFVRQAGLDVVFEVIQVEGVQTMSNT